MRRVLSILWWILGSGAMIVTTILLVGLWGSRGHLPAFVDGQFDPGPALVRDVSVAPPPGEPARVTITIGDPLRRTDPRYLSFAIDTSAVVGGKWWDPAATHPEVGTGTVPAPVFDFDRPRLDTLVRELRPAILRIGGSEADKVYYAIDEAVDAPPAGFESVLTRAQWDGVADFVDRNGLDLVMTLNAGPASRDSDGAWQPDNAETLVRHAAKQGHDVDIWELGNELNLFWFVHGVDEQVPAQIYAADVRRLRALVARHDPGASVASQSAAHWPVFGEPLGLLFGIQRAYLAQLGPDVGIVGWHYYPQQSRRGPIASRRATPGRLLDPANLDEAAHWARHNAVLRDAYAPDAPLWLGETGNAQFGGEPGLSDRALGSLWWLDQLGLLARHDHDVVIRQTLAGSNYQLITADTLEPLPDYWASVLWKRLMGPEVLDVTVVGADRARAYAHRTPNGEGTSLLVINLDPQRSLEVEGLPAGGTLRAISTPDLFGTVVHLNGEPLRLVEGAVPDLPGVATPPQWTVNPVSYAFVTWP